MTKNANKLDNPVWHSLRETHSSFVVDMENACFYQPDYCPFGGFISENGIANKMDRYAALIADFYIVGEKPAYNPALRLNKELVCNQMLLEKPMNMEADTTVVKLGSENSEDLFKLVNLVQPGYFRNKTPALGSYFGIYKDAALIAVTGERMKMNAYTEVSAVVTHPEHTGKGYAKRLVAYTVNKIFEENKMPYLHVADGNAPAIHLYEKLGFRTRRKISFWNFIKDGVQQVTSEIIS